MRKITFFLAFLIFSIGSLNAKPIDSDVAKALGVKFINANTTLRFNQADLVYTAQTEQGDNAFYVFTLYPKGFVIVAADDRMKPILGYSTESNFHPDYIADGLQTFFDNYKAGVTQMIENDDIRSEQAVEDWTRLTETGKINVERIDRGVEPLLSSIWNQTDLYNNMAPEDPNSTFNGHCKSGCVANAMSQIMRYWEWPRHGQGSHGYNAYSYYGNYGWQQANFGEATYRFELMPDFLDYASPQYEVDATALLEYHAGVGVEMGYGATASGAYSEDVPDALIDYFRYDDEMDHRYKNNQTQSQWEDDLRENLDGGMPLYYASSGNTGGHAYVLDGYDDNNMFHLNWGWAGWDNGYYAIDGFYLTYYSYPWYHNAVFNIHPVDVYYEQPKAIENLSVKVAADVASIEFDPVYETLEGEALNSIDTIVIIRDGQVIERLTDVTDPHILYTEGTLVPGTYYYAVYAKNADVMSKVVRDTLIINHNSYYRFVLHDSQSDGWDMSSVAVLDTTSKIMGRAGLMDGGEAEVIMQVPCDQDLILLWTYDNVCYTHGTTDQCSFEVYDETDNLLYESPEALEVGELITLNKQCPYLSPDFITAQYVFNDGSFGVQVSWALDDHSAFQLLRYDNPNEDPAEAFVFEAGENSYFDEVNPGIYYYRVRAIYEVGGTTIYSDFAPNLDDPAMDYANVEVTSVIENGSSVEVISETIFDLSGREINKGEMAKGIYLVRQVMSDGTVRIIKECKKD